MFRSTSISVALLAILAIGRSAGAEDGPILNLDALRGGLRTGEPSEVDYLHYVATLLKQGRIRTGLVDALYHYARRKRVFSQKFTYFKQGLILEAAKERITMPKGTPDVTPKITGRVTAKVLGIDKAVPKATVTLLGTKTQTSSEDKGPFNIERKTTTDADGRFSFQNVPYGVYTITGKGFVVVIPPVSVFMAASVNLTLPTRPPSSDVVSVTIEVLPAKIK